VEEKELMARYSHSG